MKNETYMEFRVVTDDGVASKYDSRRYSLNGETDTHGIIKAARYAEADASAFQDSGEHARVESRRVTVTITEWV